MATEIGTRWKFSPDAIRVLQLSSFCVDYFGPFITEAIGFVEKNASYLELRNLPTTGRTHAASNFMHFDNLAGQLDRNWKFDYLWSRLLDNTRNTVASYYKDTSLKPDDRKRLILLALGASLHMVEDFYSHTDWIHFDFVKKGFHQQKTAGGEDRTPTWFEVRKRLGAPNARQRTENWKFRICSGVFPPADNVPLSTFGVPISHTMMNHDNSQLYYDGASQIKYHAFGVHPAMDSASAVEHQLFAYHTAIEAGIEWIGMLENDPAAKRAIDFAKGWDMKSVGADVADDLKDGLYSSVMISCIMQKWDGNYPPPERAKDCGVFKLLAHIHVPTMENTFWGSFPKDSILEHLSVGFGDSTGHYTFDSLWVGRHPMKHE
ncbi:MAG: hypothetical protein Q8921_05700 [Bacteroidota bacterium]|nr:hypothetical protein [Bacteroidota bacterium]